MSLAASQNNHVLQSLRFFLATCRLPTARSATSRMDPRGTLKLCLGNPVPLTEAPHPELQVLALRGGKSLGSPEQEGANLNDFRQEVFQDTTRGNTNFTKGVYGESL